MNIGEIQQNLSNFSQQTSNAVNSISDKIEDIKDKTQEGLSAPMVLHGIAEGNKVFGNLTKRGGKKLKTLGNTIENKSRNMNSLRSNDLEDFSARPTNIRTQQFHNPNTTLNNENPRGLSQVSNKSVVRDTPVAEQDISNPLKDYTQSLKNVMDEPKSAGNVFQDTISRKPAYSPATQIAQDTKEISTGEKVGQTLSKVGEGLEAVGESGIPFVSEISDVGGAVLGGYELIKSLSTGGKVKKLQEQRQQLENRYEPQNVITNPSATNQSFSIGSGSLNF